MADLEHAAKKIHEAIFNDGNSVEIDNEKIMIKTFSGSGLRYADYSDYRLIEQNPNKSSHWAKKARNGHEITWILEGNDYIGQVYDGNFKSFDKK
ncbi:MAG: hypothetical protein EU551_00385 [Promethearchaeota archaeon]|nr:MAG: hypothetical protein EU551_00385 [Candidatus Lokiarchaeota archaeon]